MSGKRQHEPEPGQKPPQTMNPTLQKALAVLFEPGDVIEVRIPNHPYNGATAAGYFNDFAKLALAAARFSGRAAGVYVTLNRINPALLARSTNRVLERARNTTADGDVLRRLWLPVDFDPKRPAGISSSEAEHAAALSRARQCRDWLAGRGWPLPVEADSGNGAHLLYRIDLANNDGARDLVSKCLTALDYNFSDGSVQVDTGVYNAARIWKLYGTLSAKGDPDADRPHRLACILATPEPVPVVSVDLLEALAGMGAPEEPGEEARASRPGAGTGRGSWDLRGWIEEHKLPIAFDGPWQNGGHKWVFRVCPFNDEHTDRSACVVQFANGKVAFKCHHNGCQGKSWQDLRRLYEPGCYGRRQPGAGPGGAQDGGKTDTTTRAAEWLAPVPLNETPPVPPFPTHLLPALVRQFVEEGAAAIHCPPDYLGLPLLTLAGAALGTSLALRIKPGWQEPSSIYGAVIAPPGSAKSPGLHAVARPVYARQAELYETFRAAAKAAEEDTDAPAPKLQSIYSDDTTVERLAELLQDNPRGLAVIKDELSEWVLALNQYRPGGRGADRPFFCKLWSGSPVRVDRKSQKGSPLFVPRPFLGLIGGLQPDRLALLRSERGLADGFLDRFLFAFPEPPKAQGEDWQTISEEATKAWSDVLQGLRGLDPAEELTVDLSPEGAEAWVAFTAGLAQEKNADDFPDFLHGPWSKLQQ